MRGFSYYHNRARKRKRRESLKRQKTTFDILAPLFMLPFVGVVMILEAIFSTNNKRTTSTRTRNITNKYYHPNGNKVNHKKDLVNDYKSYLVQLEPGGLELDYIFYMDNELNSETYERRLLENQETLTYLMNNQSIESLQNISGIDEYIANQIIQNRPYKSCDDVLARCNDFNKANLHHWVMQLDKKGQERLSKVDNGAQPIKTSIQSTTYPSIIILNWGENIDKAVIRRNGFMIDEVYNTTNYIDKPLYSNEKYTYEIILKDVYGNHRMYTHVAKTKNEGISFRGLSPIAFIEDQNNTYKGQGTVKWLGHLTNKTIEVKYRYTGPIDMYGTFMYFRDKNNNNISNNPESETFTASVTHDVITERVKVPWGANRIEIVGRHTEIFHILVVD